MRSAVERFCWLTDGQAIVPLCDHSPARRSSSARWSSRPPSRILELGDTIGLAEKTRASCYRVLIADSCPTYRLGLRCALERSDDLLVVAAVGTGAEALAAVAEADTQPDLAVLEVDLPDRSGIGLCRQLAVERPEIAVVMLSYFDWDIYLVGAWAARAAGFVLKQQDTEHIVDAMRAAVTEPLFTRDQLMRIYTWRGGIGEKLVSLGEREWQALELIAEGASNHEIADALVVSINTVEKHASSILRKLGLQSRAQLHAFILQHHLVTPAEHLNWRRTVNQEWWNPVIAK